VKGTGRKDAKITFHLEPTRNGRKARRAKGKEREQGTWYKEKGRKGERKKAAGNKQQAGKLRGKIG
jgi:hypothetical protein